MDVASGDLPIGERLNGVVDYLQRNSTRALNVCGQTDVLDRWLHCLAPSIRDRVELTAASQVIDMDDGPVVAMRRKPDSSMRMALQLVATGQASACVSAGNTGALMGLSRHLLKTLPGIDRPAICSQFPSISGRTHALDMGANVSATAEQLLQFAIMGEAVAATVGNVRRPRIGLLNVGVEAGKGNDSVRKAASLLKDSPLDYIGFVEGNDLYTGKVDVLVCDGFTGNVALKASEGVARFVRLRLQENFSTSLRTRLQGWIAGNVVRKVGEAFDPRRFNGASLVGLRGVVVKSHGNSDGRAFSNAIGAAAAEVDNGVLNKIRLRIPRAAIGDSA